MDPPYRKLIKKLNSATGMLKRIRHNIPPENFKSLYYSLFESHLSYCITVFGSANKTHMEKLFRVQKHCIRILFGDLEAYLDKFKTSARSRPRDKQILGSDFYCKEHTKPIFYERKILSCMNIYNYQMCLETLKILKFRLPSSIYSLFTLSPRNNGSYLIIRPESDAFIMKCSKIWNTVIKLIAKDEIVPSINISNFKQKLRSCLLDVQNAFDRVEWYPKNFEIETGFKIKK